MATRKGTAQSTRNARTRQIDAVTMLKQEHAEVDALFNAFEKAKGSSRKERLVAKICRELTIHTTIEEEILYPAVRESIGEDDLMDEADVEHAGAKNLIAQLEEMSPGEDKYDAKVKVLSEYIKHHVEEEHTEMFPKARKSDLDLVELAVQMQDRRREMEKSA